MADTLSPDQISALFAAAEEGNLPNPSDAPRQRSARVTPVDFARPSKFTKDQERTLRRAHETFCRTASTGLGADMRTAIDLEVVGVAQLNWSNALLEVGPDAVCAIVDIDPLGTKILLAVERIFALTLIERQCGGSLVKVPADRRLTDIDMVMTKRIFRLFVEQLSLVWHEFSGVDLGLSEIEPEPGSAQIATLSEPTLIVTIEIRMNRGSFTLSVLLPWSAIEGASGRFNGGEHDGRSEDPRDAVAMNAALGAVPVNLRAEVGAVEISATDLLALKEGDVVRFGPAKQGVTLYADDIPIKKARPGRDGGRRAIQVFTGEEHS
jgi:flagellar motor switch protein FliM